MSAVRLVIHGHFYQPPRENPWTEEVAVEPSAAPFHDWNERVTAECYRPNGWARVVDDTGRVSDIVNNYAHLSFNVGPTLLAWLERHRPEVYRRIVEGDREGGGAIAQAFSHAILPLCTERDIRTQVRWGLADFAHRFGRRAEGMWLPETAVNDTVLRILVEEGVEFTLLAPDQAAAPVAGGWPYRWAHPSDDGRSITLVFYDGGISHDLAFRFTGMSSQELVRRAIEAAHDGSPVCVATDGETFGHHHKFTERALAYAFAHQAAANSVRVMTAAALVRELPPTAEARVRESSWSCIHGVGRWREDCGCSTGGEPGWNQRWRAPLRAAFDLLRDFGAEVFERRGAAVLKDPWAARDAYIEVMLERQPVDDFLAEHGTGGAGDAGAGYREAVVTALTLLEAQRHAMLMYTSCGWFFHDLAGIETLQVMRYAARVIDLLSEVGEEPPVSRFLEVLGRAESNLVEEGTGADIWARHIEPTRVDGARVTAHVALVDLLEERRAGSALAGFDLERHDHQHRRRGGVTGCAGTVALCHRRTRRRSEHVYAAIRLGGLEVFGAVRLADHSRDPGLLQALDDAVSSGARVSVVVRLIMEAFGPREFGLESALPDAADQIVRSAAETLVDRFVRTLEHLYDDNRALIEALVSAGYPLPPELRAPAELALARRFEHEITAVADPADVGSFGAAHALVLEARAGGFRLNTPRAAAVMGRALLAAVRQAVTATGPHGNHVGTALALLRLTRDLDLELNLDEAQEAVFAALEGRAGGAESRLVPLARALHLAV